MLSLQVEVFSGGPALCQDCACCPNTQLVKQERQSQEQDLYVGKASYSRELNTLYQYQVSLH